MEDIKLPSKVSIKEISKQRAQIIVEPCYPGFGQTLGNATRRVLLSSLPGAAVTAVKIKGVQHEFSTIDHMKEDVVEIILNLKRLRLKLSADEETKLTLKVKGEKKVTAKDIKTPSQAEIINKDLLIATLTDKAAELDMEITVARGRGYVPVENRQKEKLDIGNIAIDAIYTPVKNVNFEVSNVRVEQMTNYDRLALDIQTDGTITPEESFKIASSILVDHFSLLSGNLKKDKDEKEKEEKKKQAEKDEEEDKKEQEKNEDKEEETKEDKDTDKEKDGEKEEDKDKKKEKKKRGRPPKKKAE